MLNELKTLKSSNLSETEEKIEQRIPNQEIKNQEKKKYINLYVCHLSVGIIFTYIFIICSISINIVNRIIFWKYNLNLISH